MSTTSDLLAARVLNAVPASSYEMSALLSVLRIEATTEVPTACVSCERRPVLRINPEFVDTWCRTDEHLFMLVMHELHHVLLGHTRHFRRVTHAHNVAFDAVINALLCKRFPGRAYTSFFSSFYADAEGAGRLLAPPDGRPWPEGDPLRTIHLLLYGGNSVSAQEAFEWIVRAKPEMLESVVLLGGHDAESDGDVARDEIAGAIRSAVEKWPDVPGLVPGGGWDLVRVRVEAVPVETAVWRAVRKALLSAATGGDGPRRRGWRAGAVPTAVPNVRDRRAAVARAAGTPTLFFDTLFTERTSAPQGRAAVYVDVSGSMTPYLPPLYAALRRLRRHVRPEVHLFSTVVHTVRLQDLCSGARLTTYGNELDPVLDHLLRELPPRALWVTDGLVGRASAAMRDRFARRPVDLRVLLLPHGSRQDLAGFATRFDELPSL